MAEHAGAGKASIYARFAAKEALFLAVIGRSVDRALPPPDVAPRPATTSERLEAVGLAIIEGSLRPSAVALMRLIVAEAARFPELAKHADRLGWRAGVRRVSEAMIDDDSASPAAIDAVWPVAARFIDLVFIPLQMRALCGEPLPALQAHAPRQIAEALTVLEALGDIGRSRT